MRCKKVGGGYHVICDQRFFTIKDCWVYLVPQKDILIVLKGDVPIQKGLDQISSYIDE